MGKFYANLLAVVNRERCSLAVRMSQCSPGIGAESKGVGGLALHQTKHHPSLLSTSRIARRVFILAVSFP
jgi:hypothetical protein